MLITLQRDIGSSKINTMGQTSIEWTATYLPDGRIFAGFTFNPWIGCAEESKACEHCYARTVTFVNYARSKGKELWGKRAERHRTKTWDNPRRWHRQAVKENVRLKVFCASLADIMEDEPLLPQREEMNEWRKELFPLIEETFMLDWLLCTKRPQNYLRLVPLDWQLNWPRHVWAGTTVEENNVRWRITDVLKTGARVTFLSVEPNLAPLDLMPWIPTPDRGWKCVECLTYHTHDHGDEECPICRRRGWMQPHTDTKSYISWVIVGGESGGSARPMQVDWVRALRDQCTLGGIKFFMKQGSAANWPDYDNYDSFPEDLKIREQPVTTF